MVDQVMAPLDIVVVDNTRDHWQGHLVTANRDWDDGTNSATWNEDVVEITPDSGCAVCHGANGSGESSMPLADELGRSITPRDLRAGVFRGGAADEDLYRRIRLGIPGTAMGRFTPEDFADLVAFAIEGTTHRELTFQEVTHLLWEHGLLPWCLHGKEEFVEELGKVSLKLNDSASSKLGLLLNRNCKFVPAGLSIVGPVKHAMELWRARESPNGRCQRSSPGRRTNLVGYNLEFIPIPG